MSTTHSYSRVLLKNASRANGLPPLLMVRAFEATARTGTMRKAAEDVGITHSVISRHIRVLEAWMKVKLVQAGPRGVVLTREGKIFYSAVSRAFGTISAVTAELRPSGRRRIVQIWCMPGLATRWLIPRMSEVQGCFPDAEILLRASERLPDFACGEADIMIGCAGSADGADVPDAAAPLIEPRVFPVASNQWIKDHGTPTTIEELRGATLIHEDTPQYWTDWFAAAGIALVNPLRGPRVSYASLDLSAALAAQGIALATCMTAGVELDRGALVELFETDIRLGTYYFLAAPARRAFPEVSRFYKWLTTQLRISEEAHRPDISRQLRTVRA